MIELLLGAHARGDVDHAGRRAGHAAARIHDRAVDHREVALIAGGDRGQGHAQRLDGDGLARAMHLPQQRLQHVRRGVAEDLAHGASAMHARRHPVHLGQRVVDAHVPEVGVVDGQPQRRVAQQQIHARAGAVARGHEQAHGDAGADEERERDDEALDADRRGAEPHARDHERRQERREQPGADTGEPRDEYDRGIEGDERDAPAPKGIEEGVHRCGQQHGESRRDVAQYRVGSSGHLASDSPLRRAGAIGKSFHTPAGGNVSRVGRSETPRRW